MKRFMLGFVLSLFGTTAALAQSGGAPAGAPAKPAPDKPAPAAADKAAPTGDKAAVKPAEPASPPGMDPKAMAAMEAYAKPGPEHAKLKALEGTWDAKITMWMDPKAPPMEMSGKTENKMVMDRYLQQQFTGDMGGMPFQGMGIVAYNNVLKKYQSTWIDNMGTGVITGEGTADKDGKTLTFTLVSTDAMKGKNVKMKDVWKIEGNSITTEMWAPPPKGGKDYKMMQIVYTKK